MYQLTWWFENKLREFSHSSLRARLLSALSTGVERLRSGTVVEVGDANSIVGPSNSSEGPAATLPSSGRDAISEWRSIARRTLMAVAVFSVFVNLLMLTMPLYLFQLSDRVLTSRSLDTLLMLTIVALGFIGVLSLLDIMRRQVLGRLATKFATILGGPVLASIVTTAKIKLTAPTYRPFAVCIKSRASFQARSCCSCSMSPLAPIYFAAVFLIHPDLGFISPHLRPCACCRRAPEPEGDVWPLGKCEFATGRGRTLKRKRCPAIRKSSMPWEC